MPGTNLPSDEVLLEQAIRTKIADTLYSVPLIQQFVNVEKRERFPDSDEDDENISSVADPLQPNIRFTSLIQIGIPTVEEFERTSDKHTQLNFVYPLKFEMAIKDLWNDPEIDYNNSSDLFIAIYMQARRKFKDGDRDFGYNNCVHLYLQQELVTTEDDEEGPYLHVAEWSLTVQCTGVLV
jgi:hypothetical protein